MMKVILFCVAVALNLVQVQTGKTCKTERGKVLTTFSNTREMIKFPCKYNAIRDSICGQYKVTVSPGNILEPQRNRVYIIKSLWVAVQRLSDGKKWQGRTDLKVARKYMSGIQSEPFDTKLAEIPIGDIFTFSDPNREDEVTLTEKNKDFKITFGLYNAERRRHRSSTFGFVCHSNNFQFPPYATQLCGNGTVREVKKYKLSQQWRENRQATIFYNVFNDAKIRQTDENCILAQKAMTEQCTYNGEDLRYTAIKLCWPILAKGRYQYCISRNMDNPLSAFRHCIQFVCSGYQDQTACEGLGNELDFCPSLEGVSNVVKNTCMPNLYNP